MGRPGTFNKGQSGNAKGRPPLTPEQVEVRTLARQKTQWAFDKLCELAEKGADESVRRHALESILDRGHGRPAQAVELSGPAGGPVVVSGIAGLAAAMDAAERAAMEASK